MNKTAVQEHINWLNSQLPQPMSSSLYNSLIERLCPTPKIPRVGTKFQFRSMVYEVTGFKPSRPKFCIECKGVANGRGYGFPKDVFEKDGGKHVTIIVEGSGDSFPV